MYIYIYRLDHLGPLDLEEWKPLDTQRLLTSAAENRVEVCVLMCVYVYIHTYILIHVCVHM
jgi:hypothetical protein